LSVLSITHASAGKGRSGAAPRPNGAIARQNAYFLGRFNSDRAAFKCGYASRGLRRQPASR